VKGAGETSRSAGIKAVVFDMDGVGYPLTASQWVEARRVAIEPDPAVLALARQLSATSPVGMFTNNPWLLKRHIAEVLPRAIFSAELGRCKPDPEAFRRLAARLEVAPEGILYLDDDAAYVAGARGAGLSAEQVSGATDVRRTLAAHGLPVARQRLPRQAL
jgi:putative hydrolase of the HAD superfamily